MKVYKKVVEVQSASQVEFVNITDKVQEVVTNSGVREGQVLIYSPHTTAGIVINHDESMLIQDFMRILYKLVPVSDRYSHDLFELNRIKASDGRSNGHSHCKVMLLGGSQTVPIEKGKMLLTERQTIFVAEMDGARKREIIVQVIGL